jgi:hypothetical protein
MCNVYVYVCMCMCVYVCAFMCMCVCVCVCPLLHLHPLVSRPPSLLEATRPPCYPSPPPSPPPSFFCAPAVPVRAVRGAGIRPDCVPHAHLHDPSHLQSRGGPGLLCRCQPPSHSGGVSHVPPALQVRLAGHLPPRRVAQPGRHVRVGVTPGPPPPPLGRPACTCTVGGSVAVTPLPAMHPLG